MNTTTKLTSTKTKPSRRAQVWLDDKADAYLSASIVNYTQMFGRPVSTSLVVRRALDLLAKHTRNLDSKGERKAEEAIMFLSAR